MIDPKHMMGEIELLQSQLREARERIAEIEGKIATLREAQARIKELENALRWRLTVDEFPEENQEVEVLDSIGDMYKWIHSYALNQTLMYRYEYWRPFIAPGGEK